MKTLLFDLDGTLTDNYAGISASIRHACVALGHRVPDEAALRGCVGPPLRRTFARVLAVEDPEVIERAIGHYRDRFASIGWSENEVYPGVAAMLGHLRASGHRLYVCTAKPLVYAQRIVAHFGFDAWFMRVYGADLAGHLDDKRDLLAHLIDREAIDPAAAVMIGDRAHDMLAAKANGVHATGVLWGYGTEAELLAAGADAVAETPAALIDTLGRYNSA